jgi:hypothetical protein
MMGMVSFLMRTNKEAHEYKVIDDTLQIEREWKAWDMHL